MSANLYEIVTAKIVAALERGVIPWRQPWRGSSLPVNAITQRAYRGVNVFLLALTPYTDHRWLTWIQLKERGGRVNSGEKATMVVFWKRLEQKSDDETDHSERTRQVPLLRYYHVFNAEQCADHGLPPLYRPPEITELERIERAELLVSSMPNPPPITFGSEGWYNAREDIVQVPPLGRYSQADHYYGTLFHELGHATGHSTRLNRKGVADRVRFGSGEYSQEELVAELTSAFCCATAMLDADLIEDSASYIDCWLRVLKSDPKVVVMASAQAQRAADFIRGIC